MVSTIPIIFNFQYLITLWITACFYQMKDSLITHVNLKFYRLKSLSINCKWFKIIVEMNLKAWFCMVLIGIASSMFKLKRFGKK